MKIGGTDTKHWGLVPIKTTGALDMPGRLDEYAYDWGDIIEPIFSQMAWQGRNIDVEFLYDPRIQDGTYDDDLNPFDNFVQLYKNTANPTTLELTERSGSLGIYNVVVDRIYDHRRFKVNDTVKIRFYERIPVFNGVLPTKITPAPDISLDGYKFSSFGIVISRLHDLSTVSEAKASSITQYNLAQKKSAYRGLNSFKLECYCIGSSAQDLLIKMESFKKLMASAKPLTFKYKTYLFSTFFAVGFKVEKRSKRLAKFDLNLFRV
jgi:hypothetical protein